MKPSGLSTNNLQNAILSMNDSDTADMIDKYAAETERLNNLLAQAENANDNIGSVDSSFRQINPYASDSPVGNGVFDSVIENIQKQNLKYSQKRGKGCTDCSAFVQTVYKDALGKQIPGWTEAQWKHGRPVKGLQDAKYGDLVFFNSGKLPGRNVTHVGIYKGNGLMDHFGIKGLQRNVNINQYAQKVLPMVGIRRYI